MIEHSKYIDEKYHLNKLKVQSNERKTVLKIKKFKKSYLIYSEFVEDFSFSVLFIESFYLTCIKD